MEFLQHNQLYAKAQPLSEELIQDIEQGKIGPRDDFKLRARALADEVCSFFLLPFPFIFADRLIFSLSQHGWDVTEARKIWCFGPDGGGPNLLVDSTKGVQVSSAPSFTPSQHR